MKASVRWLLLGLLLIVLTTDRLIYLSAREDPIPQRKVPPEYVQIVRRMEAKEYDRAIDECKQLIAKEPTFDGAYRKLVEAFKEKKDLESAVRYLQTLRHKNDQNPCVYYGLGFAFRELKDSSQAEACFKKAMDLWPQFTAVLFEFVFAYNRSKRLHEARAYLQELAKVNERYAPAYLGLGFTYYLDREWAEALRYLDQTLERDSELLAAYQMKGDIQCTMGRFSMCSDLFERLLKLAVNQNDLLYEGNALNGLGRAANELGNYSKAIDYYLQALKIQRETKNKQGEASTLNGIGINYDKLGDYSKAIHYYLQAIPIAKELKDRNGEATILYNIGVVYMKQGNYLKARDFYGHALKIRQEIKDRQGQGYTLTNLGITFAREGNYTQALDYFEHALTIRRETGDKLGEGITLNSMGDVYERVGDYQRAIDSQKGAFEIAELLNHKESIWKANASLASVLEKQGRLAESLDHYKSSIKLIEEMRGELGVEEYKTVFLQNKVQVYEKITTLLFKLYEKNPEQGYDKQAFDYAERAKARAFLDTLAEARAHVRKGMSPQQIAEEQALFRNISGIQSKLFGKQLAEKERKRLNEELKTAENKLEDFKNQLRKSNPAYADLRYPEPYGLARVQKELIDDSSLVLEFLLGEKKSFLWLVSSQSLEMIALPKRQEIERRVRAYRKLLSAPPQGTESFTEYYQQGYQLFRLLLGPIKNKVGRHKRLIIIPDGVLHYLPFETLITASGANWETKPPRHLMDDHDVAYAPSASVLGRLSAVRHSDEDRLELLAYGNPVLNAKKSGTGIKATLSNSEHGKVTAARSQNTVRASYAGLGINLEPLPNSKREVEALAGLYPERLRRVYLGAQATESAVKRERLSKYRRIHFATHGLIDEQVPARSGLILSASDGEEDGILQMNEIFDLELDAELVVLSACQSGLGKLVRGEGMVGLTRAFLYAGAESVVVSLWSVNDESTAEFMKSFYRHMKSGKSRSEALRLAKRAMIKSTTPAYKFPYFWAPFVLIGRARS